MVFLVTGSINDPWTEPAQSVMWENTIFFNSMRFDSAIVQYNSTTTFDLNTDSDFCRKKTVRFRFYFKLIFNLISSFVVTQSNNCDAQAELP